MKKLFAAILTCLAAFNYASALESWVDVTDKHIVNPRFDNDDRTTGWWGDILGAYNPKENAEHYNKNYDTYQNINVTPGKYRLSLNAFYREGTAYQDFWAWTNHLADNTDGTLNDCGSKNALIYVYNQLTLEEKTTPIMLLYTGHSKTNYGGNTSSINQEFVPDNMIAADLWFNEGYYLNTLEFEINEECTITIGIRKNTTVREDWTCIDNWKLEKWDTVKSVEKIELNTSGLSLIMGMTQQVEAYVTPADATFTSVTWSIEDATIAKVDKNGVVTPTGLGNTVLTATAADGSGVSKSIPVEVTSNGAAPSADNIVINEIMAANVDVYLDPNQNYGSWVEIYNPSDKPVLLSGLYVTDDPENLKKHKLVDYYGGVSAHGYQILNFDHHEVWTENAYRQIDDKLDCDGGTVIISDGKNIIAQQDYPAAISRVSYARTTDGGDTWSYSGNPTPMASNADGKFASEQLDAPVVDKDAQLFTNGFQATVSIPEGATLKYTLDGTAPTLTNGEVSATGIFDISNTTTLRLRLFKDGYLPSKVITRSYIQDNGNYPFPIISVVTDADNIYSKDRGAFSQGPYGRPGNGQTGKCNWNMDWDHPVNFEFITKDNECIVSQECDFSMCGGWSRAWEPHSFKLKANKAYDFVNFFAAELFSEKPNLKQKTLQIRNGGNDNGCRIKDAALQRVIASSGLYVDYQACEPVHVFINGTHYNVLNMREPNNKHHGYANYGIDTDYMEQFEMSPDSGYCQMEGDGSGFRLWYELSKDAANESKYEEIQKIVDIDEYINYMACEMYVGNWDWPQNNVKGYREVNGGKFHFVLFDLDGALSTSTPFSTFLGKQMYTFDDLKGYDYSISQNMNGQRRYREIEFVTIFKNMLQNDKFRKQFIDAYSIVNGSVFDPQRTANEINKQAEYLSTGGYVWPGNTVNTLINSFSSGRQNSMMNNLKATSLMKLTAANTQNANISSNIEEGKIFLNDQVIPTGKLNGQVFSPVVLKATAPAGYTFAGWKTIGSFSTREIFSKGSEWYYYDGGSLDGEDWKASSYSANGWKSGKAGLGYGKNGYTNTTTASNLPTYYFRKTVELASAPDSEEEFTLDFIIDDGMVVYVNGTEVGRYLMPNGTVFYSTLSSTYASDNPNTGSMAIGGKYFKKGKNVIAIEVHNNSTTSSDILLDASLSQKYRAEGDNVISTEPVYTCPGSGDINVVATWTKMTDEQMIAANLNTAPVVINELSAANTVFVNDYYKKNDWIELYNTTGKDVDIAGLYISDNASKPTKYQVPADNVTLNTVIPANGYKVIWCDKLDNISDAIHTSFKLGNEDGLVMIAKGKKGAKASEVADGSAVEYTDTLNYNAQLGSQSFGRYPDANTLTYIFDKPTPGKANVFTSYAVGYKAPEKPQEEPNGIDIVNEGGMLIAYVDGVINAKSENADIESVNVVSISGMSVPVDVIRNTGSYVTINARNLPKGIYIAVATNADGDSCKVKFVIR